jgi:YggT family protein
MWWAGVVVWDALGVFLIMLLVRLVVDVVQSFARAWRPRGIVLVCLEIVYTITDPPLKLFRSFIPPLRLGGIALDIPFLLVLILTYVARWVVGTFWL